MTRITAIQSLLVLVDVQERLLPVVRNPKELVVGCRLLLDAAQLMGVPVVVTEQYPKGLGATVPELATHPVIVDRCEKLRFSAAETVCDLPVVASTADRVFVLAGIETHICIQQTALDLAADGQRVVVIADACSSRNAIDHDVAIERMRSSGILITTVEAIVFEWCEIAGTDTFKSLSRLVRAREGG